MKKNYFYLLATIMIAMSFSLLSCSDDDEREKDEQNIQGSFGGDIDKVGKAELYIDGAKANVLQEWEHAPFTYDLFGGGAVGLTCIITCEDSEGKSMTLELYFSDIEDVYHNFSEYPNYEHVLASLKKDDDFTKMSPQFWYVLQGNSLSDTYSLAASNNIEQTNSLWKKECIGSVKITKKNQAAHAIRIDFKDIQVVKEDNKGNTTETSERIKINGYIEGPVYPYSSWLK